MSDQPQPVWAAPLASHLAAEEELDRARVTLESALATILETWGTSIEREVLNPFQTVLDEVEQAHTRLLAELVSALDRNTSGTSAATRPIHVTTDSGEPAPATSGESTTPPQVSDEERRAHCAAVSMYVEAVHNECFERVQEYLGDANPAVALERLLGRTQDRVAKAAAQLPSDLHLPVGLTLVSQAEPDGVGMGMRQGLHVRGRSFKVAGRTLRNRVGKAFGRPGRQLPQPTRHCDPAEVAKSRLAKQLLPALMEAHVLLRNWLQDQLKTLERSAWTWTSGGLRFVTDLDLPEYHVTSDIRLRWPETEPAHAQALPEPTFAATLKFECGDAPLVAAPDLTLVFQALTKDLAVAGTFLYRGFGVAGWPSPPEPPPAFARDRLFLCDGLLDLYHGLRDVEDGFLREIAFQALVPLERTYDDIKVQLREIEADAHRLIDGQKRRGPSGDAKLVRELERLLEQSEDIDRVYRDLPGLSSADRALSSPGEGAWRGVLKRVALLPDGLHLRGSVGDKPRSYNADLRDTARTAFERPIPPRIESAADPLRRSVAKVWNETEQVRDVVRNTIHTIIQQLSEDELEEAVDEVPTSEVDTDLKGLVSRGMDRAADSLEDRYQTLGPDWANLVTQVHRVLTEDWNATFRAVQSDDFLAKRLLRIQIAAVRQSERSAKWVADAWTAGVEHTVARFRLVRTRARNLIRFGRTVVGVSTATTEERHLALDTVANARTLYAKLPLVYRRLFSVDPVSDPGLAENRVEDLKSAEIFLERWRADLGGGVLIVHGPLGSGRTSFLRLLESTLRDDLRTIRLSLDRRPSGEKALAGVLARVLYPEEPFEGGFSDLEDLIQNREEVRGTLVLVDNLEMLLFQAPGGTELLNKLLLFWIRTDDRVAWCATAGSLAWQFATKAATGASRLAVSQALTQWASPSISELILRRHRRSGVSLEFEAPDDHSPLVKQRLRRAKTPQDAQRILASEFFDGLFKVVGQNPRRALFEWIRSGTFSEQGDLLTLRPIKPLSFSYLQQFENDVAFTMRAFIFHNILTVEEHALLFRSTEAGSIMAFETLLSEGLIEALDPVEGAAIMPGVRYRLRRLVLEPIVRSLQERNFVY
jgi:hypothetical protein